MDCFVIDGGRPLFGRISINGSKNAALPIMAASLLTDESLILHDVPDLRDIANMRGLLDELGCEAEWEARGTGVGPMHRRDACATRTPSGEPTHAPAHLPAEPGGDDPPISPPLHLHVHDQSASHARYDIVRTMRAGICVLGPLLAKRGRARVSMPGGCSIGDRPVDLHLRGLKALGADIRLEGGDIVAEADGLTGATIFLGGPSGSTVLGTANVMSAATLARGVTVIESAACEPEVVNLAETLNAMGARIEGAGTPRIIVHGVEELGPAEVRIMPDRIEAGTYILAAAITNGHVTIDNCPLDSLLALLDRLDEVGVSVVRIDHMAPGLRGENGAALGNGSASPGKPGAMYQRCTVRVESTRRLRPAQVTTQPHPGFPTDLQAQMMALLSLADGNSIITERIYQERFLHVAELSRMGARLYRQGPTVVVSGVPRLVGAPVMASDLRASACLVLAGLAAEGRTTVNRVYHLDRGYQRMEERLAALGASIQRVRAEEPAVVG